MNEGNIQEQEIYTIGNKKYNVIVKTTKESLSKEKLIKLIVAYGMQELES